MSVAATDAVWIDVLPSMRKFGPELARGADAASKSAGQSAGQNFAVAFAANMASRVVTGAVTTMLGGVRKAIGGGFDRLMNIEQAEIKLKTLGLDVESAMAAVGKAVDGTKFAISDAADMAAQLGAGGMTAGKDMEKWLTLTADAAQFAGMEFSDMQSLMQQVALDGRVMGDTFNRFPLAVSALAEHLDVSNEEVRKLGREGAITGDMLQEALDAKIGGAAKNAGDSFLSMRDNIKTAMSAAGANLLSPVIDASMAIMPVILDLTKGVRDAMGPIGEQIGAWLQPRAEAFARTLERLPTALKAVYDLVVGGDFTSAFRETFGIEEDHPFIGFILTLRDVGITVFTELTGGVRAFAAAWAYNDGEVTSSGFPGFMERLGYIARTIFGELVGGIRAFAAAWSYNDGEVTSSGFPGFMERAAYAIRQLWEAIRNIDFSSWSGFTDSLGDVGGSAAEGVLSLGDSFSGLSPLLGDVVSALPDVARAAGALAKGALTALVAVVGFLSRHIDTVIKILPVVAAGFVAWRIAGVALAANSQRLQAAQLAMAPVLLLNNTLRLTSILLENRQTKARLAETAATAANTGATAANNAVTQTGVLARIRAAAASVAHRVAMVAATVATHAMTAAQRALNLIMRANPMALIVAAIMLLVGALVVLYKKNETVRAVIDKAWAAIKSAIMFVVDWFRNTAWPQMKSVFNALGAAVVFYWQNVVQPYFTLVWNIFKTVFGWIKDTGWPWLRDALANMGGAVLGLWRDHMQPRLTNIMDKARDVFGWIKNTGWPLVRDAFDSIGSKVRSIWETWVSPAFDAMKSGIEKVVGAFDDARRGIGTAWDKVRGIVAAPIIAVIEFVNGGIIKTINSILSWAGIGTIPEVPVPESLRRATRGGLPSSGGNVATGPGTWQPGYADGGVLPGYSPGVDNLTFAGPAGRLELSGGEAIMRPEWTRAMGAGWIDAMNRTARTGGVGGVRRALGFARGGIMPGGKGGTLSDLANLAGSIGSSVLGFLTSTNPVKWLTDRLLGGIGALANNPLVGFVRGAVGKMATGVKDKIMGLFGWGDDGVLSSSLGVPMSWQQIRALVSVAAPLARMSSGYRPGAITALGTPSLHGAGRAADFVSGNMLRDFMRVVRLMPWTEAIYSPAGNAQLYRGRPHTYTGITKAMHYDHFHLGMKQGGIFNPFVADSGVTLAPGLNLLNNKLGKPEPLGRLDQPSARQIERHYHAHGPSADELWRLVKARESDELAMLQVMPL